MSTQSNPYAPPTAHIDDVVGHSSESESIRREHIKHEASIRSVGILYYLSAAVAGVGGMGIAAASLTGPEANEADAGLMVGLGIAYAAFGVLAFFVARGIRAYQPWARTTSIVLGFLGLLGFPVGTAINGYILYLMMSAKGKRIFAPDYPAIVAATPHIKYRTSVILWVVLGVIVAGIAAAIVIPMLGR